MQKSQALAIYALVASVLVVCAVFALLITRVPLQGTGSIKAVGLGLYWNPECTNSTSSLPFGLLEPASSKNFTLYLRNEGNSAVTLNMTVVNWSPPSAGDYMTLTWNREGQNISPDEVKDFVITLSVSENVRGISSFSLDIIISGTG